MSSAGQSLGANSKVDSKIESNSVRVPKLIVNGAKAIAWIVKGIPYLILQWLASVVVVLAFDVFGLRRHVLFKNVTIAFPTLSKRDRRILVRRSLENLVLNFFEFLTLPGRDKKFAEEKIIYHGLENLDLALAKGKGVLALSLHLGNGDFACSMLTLKGYPVHLISKKFKVEWINQFWFGIRELMGTKFIDPHNPRNAFEIMSYTRKNDIVVFVLDQFMGKPFGIETPFFGRKTGTAYGLALFAQKLEAPVVPLCTYRDVDGQTHVIVDPAIEVLKQGENKDQVILENTQRFNSWIEEKIKSHPDQWMWLHRRWKKWE